MANEREKKPIQTYHIQHHENDQNMELNQDSFQQVKSKTNIKKGNDGTFKNIMQTFREGERANLVKRDRVKMAVHAKFDVEAEDTKARTKQRIIYTLIYQHNKTIEKIETRKTRGVTNRSII